MKMKWIPSLILGLCATLGSGASLRVQEAYSDTRSAAQVYREMVEWLEIYGDTHVYPGARIRDDFFCWDPLKCGDLPSEGEDVRNPEMDHLAALADEFVIRVFQETLGRNSVVFEGTTSQQESCQVNLESLSMKAEIQGDPYDDYFRFDWNDSGDWARFKVQSNSPTHLKMLSQPSALDRLGQRLLTLGPSAEQRFELKVLGAGHIRVSMWVNYSNPEDILDWRRRKVTCDFLLSAEIL
jgi:hypothetical protein